MQRATTANLPNLTYGGHTLPASLVSHLATAGATHSVPPSLFISQLYYESNWGASNVAQQNNNWGGFTWTGNPNRPSGVVVSRGTPRPASEGGYYMKFASVEDYLTDYVYLLTGQGIYNIKGHSNFSDSVKGLFIVGGAKANYATVGWEQYLSTMISVRNGINSFNSGILDQIDDNPGDYGGAVLFIFPAGTRVTSGFRTPDRPDHHGVDFGQDGSLDIVATAAGTVTRSGWSDSYGEVIYILHNINGQEWESVYAHMVLGSRRVQVGDTVTQGQLIGTMGNTGYSEGVHLHFELHKGRWNDAKSNAVDPLLYLGIGTGTPGTGPGDKHQLLYLIRRHNTNMRRMGARGRR